MKPLAELGEQASESERTLAQLFMAAERYRANPLRKRRTEVQLRSSLGARPRHIFKPLALGVLLLASSAAAAVLGHRWLDLDSLEDPPLVPRETSSLAAHQPTLAKPTRAPAVTPLEAKPEPLEAATSKTLGSDVFADSAKTPSSPKPAPARSKRVSSGEDPTRVAEALRALRKEGNPERAQALLSDYMKANPRGALAEEALALTIEAAHARRDPKAQRYAQRYLARYPGGRHTALARRVLSE